MGQSRSRRLNAGISRNNCFISICSSHSDSPVGRMFQVTEVSLRVRVNVTGAVGMLSSGEERGAGLCVSCRFEVLGGQEWLHHLRHPACPALSLSNTCSSEQQLHCESSTSAGGRLGIKQLRK